MLDTSDLEHFDFAYLQSVVDVSAHAGDADDTDEADPIELIEATAESPFAWLPKLSRTLSSATINRKNLLHAFRISGLAFAHCVDRVSVFWINTIRAFTGSWNIVQLWSIWLVAPKLVICLLAISSRLLLAGTS